MDSSLSDWKEWRRMRSLAWEHAGWSPRALAEVLGVSEPAVSQWLAAARRGGPDAVRSHPAPGPTGRPTPDQQRLIPELPGPGAEAYGSRGEVGTGVRVALAIREELGVHHHKGHVGKLRKQWGWTPQMPIRRAIRRDETAVVRWRAEVRPELLRRARRERRTLVFEDESGFYLLPGLVRTYAPKGRTPVPHERPTRDHLSVMGGRTVEGKVYTRVRQEPLDGLHRIEFRTRLRAVAAERRPVIWDGSPVHRRVAVREFAEQTEGQVRLEARPGYAPDLNPWDEGGWHHLKNVEMRNRPCRDLEELHEQFHLALGRLRQKPHLVRSFFAQAGLPITKS